MKDEVPKRSFHVGPCPAGLLADIPEDCKLSQNGLAYAICLPARRFNDVLARRRQINTDMALCLGRHLGNRPDYWLSLQDEWLPRNEAAGESRARDRRDPAACDCLRELATLRSDPVPCSRLDPIREGRAEGGNTEFGRGVKSP